MCLLYYLHNTQQRWCYSKEESPKGSPFIFAVHVHDDYDDYNHAHKYTDLKWDHIMYNVRLQICVHVCTRVKRKEEKKEQ